jgi:hypothetical protein
MQGIFAPLPYSGNFLSIHRNTSMAEYDSVSFFAVWGEIEKRERKDGKYERKVRTRKE